MNQTLASEISSSLLFRYRLPCAKAPEAKTSESGRGPLALDEDFALPDIGNDETGRKPFAELRTSWNEKGLYFSLHVTGKKQSLWCKRTQLLESDGLQFWIDTRDTHNVHRATRYCHWFLCLPQGDGGDQKKPLATMLKINRAKEHSPNINQYPLSISSNVAKTGYEMNIFVPGSTINGWDTTEHRMMGFNYLVYDRELGTQSLGVGLEYPIAEDPSLWNTLVLQG